MQRSERSSLFSKSPEKVYNHQTSQRSSSVSPRTPESKQDQLQNVNNSMRGNNDRAVVGIDSIKLQKKFPAEASTIKEPVGFSPPIGNQKAATKFLGSSQYRRQWWGRTSVSLSLLTLILSYSVFVSCVLAQDRLSNNCLNILSFSLIQAKKNLSMESIDFSLDEE